MYFSVEIFRFVQTVLIKIQFFWRVFYLNLIKNEIEEFNMRINLKYLFSHDKLKPN